MREHACDVLATITLAGVRFAQALLEQDDPAADGLTMAELGLIPACLPQQLLDWRQLGWGRAACGLDTGRLPTTSHRRSEPERCGMRQSTRPDENSKLPINALITEW